LFYDSPLAKKASKFTGPLSPKTERHYRRIFLRTSAILYSLMSKFLAIQCRYSLQLPNIQMDATSGETGILGADLKLYMKSSSKLLLVLAAATAFFIIQPVKAGHVVQGGPTYVTVPDGGSTMSLLGFALLGVAALRRKLGR
jgi:hypothetical protein